MKSKETKSRLKFLEIMWRFSWLKVFGKLLFSMKMTEKHIPKNKSMNYRAGFYFMNSMMLIIHLKRVFKE